MPPSASHQCTTSRPEQANQQLECYLRYLVAYQQHSWARYLTWVELSYNVHTYSASELSPFYHQELEVDTPLAQQLVQWCQRLWSLAHRAIQCANQCYTEQHCCQHPPGGLYNVGDNV